VVTGARTADPGSASDPFSAVNTALVSLGGMTSIQVPSLLYRSSANEFRAPSCEITGKLSPSPAVAAVRSGRTHADHENAVLVSTSGPSVLPHCDRSRSSRSDTSGGVTAESVYDDGLFSSDST